MPRMWRRMVLVTGHRRSGTTWMTAALGLSDESAYMRFEAFMVKRHPLSPFTEKVQEWRRTTHWYVGWDNYGPQRETHAQALLGHVEWLCERYFGGPVDTVLVKDPHPGRVEFLVGALQPDEVIYVRRHPLGIVNSYDKGNLYYLWSIGRDFDWFLHDLQSLRPDLAAKAKSIQHPVEQVALMAQVSQDLQPSFMRDARSLAVDYESLCLDSEVEYHTLFEWLGWHWDEQVWSNVRDLVQPKPKDVVEDFFSVTRISRQRAEGWRQELAPHLIHRVGRMFERLELEVPMPGSGLPPLQSKETSAARHLYLSRRRAYLRQWGWRGLVYSL